MNFNRVIFFFPSCYSHKGSGFCSGWLVFFFFGGVFLFVLLHLFVTSTGNSQLNFNFVSIRESLCNGVSILHSRTRHLFFQRRLYLSHFLSKAPFPLQEISGSQSFSSPVFIVAADDKKNLTDWDLLQTSSLVLCTLISLTVMQLHI